MKVFTLVQIKISEWSTSRYKKTIFFFLHWSTIPGRTM